jgi:hypothetical protein
MEEDLLIFITNFYFIFVPSTLRHSTRAELKKNCIGKICFQKKSLVEKRRGFVRAPLSDCQIHFRFFKQNISAPSEKYDHWPYFIWLERFVLNLILMN